MVAHHILTGFLVLSKEVLGAHKNFKIFIIMSSLHNDDYTACVNFCPILLSAKI
jgi:hypothetical protein